jgi:hypothetical protein
MPRVSAAAKVVKAEFKVQRPVPPPELTEAQAVIWRETTEAEPNGFFTSGAVLQMLADYCRHRETADKLTGKVERFEDDWMKDREGLNRYHTLLKMRELETRSAAHLATKLRLTNQSRFRPDTGIPRQRANTPAGPMPWE